MQLELAPGVSINLNQPPYLTEGLRIAILGNPGMGKSNLLAVLAEEAYRQGIPFLFFDPNGDACSLRELGQDVITVGHPNHHEPLRRAQYALNNFKAIPGLITMLLTDGYSLVVDLSDQDDPNLSQTAFTRFANEHFKQASNLRLPALVLVDEAHRFAPEGAAADELEKESRKALFQLVHDGRKRGIMVVAASQRSTFLSKRVIFGANVRIFGKTTYRPDYDQVIRKYVSVVSFQQLLKLRAGEVFIVGENIVPLGNLGKLQIKQRTTTDLGRTPVINPRPKPARQIALFETIINEQ